MGMIYNNCEFANNFTQQVWQDIVENSFLHVELYYRKQFSMTRLLNLYKRAFDVAHIVLKNSKDKNYKAKIFVIYLLCKYSCESYSTIAKEFNINMKTIENIAINDMYNLLFKNQTIEFFYSFKNDFFLERKSILALSEVVDKCL